MNRRKLLTFVASSGATLWLPGCGGGATTTTPAQGGIRPLGLTLPDPLEVASRLRGYVDYGSAALPTSMDNSDKCPPVGNQGNMGSCTAWATGYGLASYVNGFIGNYRPTSSGLIGSPADMYIKLLNKRGFSCGSGTIVRDALDILCNTGITTIANSPYSDSICSSPSSSGNLRISSYTAISPSDQIGMKRQLASGNVVAIGSQVTSDIYSVGSQKYMATGSNEGGHAMLVVGYDDAISAYKVMNSWGTGWGNGGYFWFDYAAFARVTREAVAALLAAPKPISNAAPTITARSGSSIIDTAYGRDFLYVFVEFSNIWTINSYKIKLGTTLIGEQTGVSQVVGASQFILDKVTNGIGYLPGNYTLELTGKDLSNNVVVLTTSIFVFQFTAIPKGS